MIGMQALRGRLGLLLLCLACHARAQEPPAAAGPPNETRVAARDPGGTPSRGPQQVQLDATAIRGNQELPKVLYIVPWKDPAMVEFAGRPANSLVEEILAPVDREVFRRQVRYFDQLYGDGQGPAAAATAEPRASGVPTGK
jgi:hypothetical protein